MLNLVEKFTPAVEADTDDAGLTMVEYAVAGAAHRGRRRHGLHAPWAPTVKGVIDGITARLI